MIYEILPQLFPCYELWDSVFFTCCFLFNELRVIFTRQTEPVFYSLLCIVSTPWLIHLLQKILTYLLPCQLRWHITFSTGRKELLLLMTKASIMDWHGGSRWIMESSSLEIGSFWQLSLWFCKLAFSVLDRLCICI